MIPIDHSLRTSLALCYVCVDGKLFVRDKRTVEKNRVRMISLFSAIADGFNRVAGGEVAAN